MLAPIFTKNSTLALSIFHRPIVRPRMYFKNARTFSAAVAENLVWPPAFEITATPNAHASHVWKLKCAVDPSTAPPLWRAHIRVRMIVE